MLARRDRGRSALEALRAAVSGFESCGVSAKGLIARGELAGELALNGLLSEAEALAQEVMADLGDNISGPWSLVRLGLDLPDTVGLSAVLGRLLGAIPHDSRSLRASLRLALGSTLLCRGYHAAAQRELSATCELARDHGFGYLDLEARRLLGELGLLRRTGSAREELARLSADAESTGHARVARRAREALEGNGT
jgi:hypothetical protein